MLDREARAWLLTGLSIAAAGALALATIRHRGLLLDVYLKGGAYYMAGVLAFVVWTVGRRTLRDGPWHGQGRARVAAWAAAGVVAAACVFAALGPQFRVVSDETNMLGVSRAIAQEQRVHVPTQGYYAHGKFTVWQTTLPDRPLLFQTLLAAVHTAVGYRAENAFALNFALLALLVAGLGLAGSRGTSPAYGAALVALVLAQPLLVFSATSASYEVLNLLLLLAGAWHLRRYTETRDPAALGAAWISFLAAANVRPESAFVAVGAAVLLYMTGLVSGREIKANRALIAATPWLVLPCLWNARIAIAPMLAQGSTRPYAYATKSAFAWQNLMLNGRNIHEMFTDVKLLLPFATFVNIAALALGAWLIWRAARAVRAGAGDPRFELVLAVGVAFQAAMIMSFWGGSVRAVPSSRYFIPLCVFLSYVVWRGLKAMPGLRAAGALAVALALYALHAGPATRQTFPLSESSIVKLAFVHRTLAAMDPSGLMVVADFPGRYTAKGYGAASFRRLREGLDGLRELMADKTIREVMVVQDFYDVLGRQPTREETMPAGVVLTTVAEARVSPSTVVRVSRLGFAPDVQAPEAVAAQPAGAGLAPGAEPDAAERVGGGAPVDGAEETGAP